MKEQSGAQRQTQERGRLLAAALKTNRLRGNKWPGLMSAMEQLPEVLSREIGELLLSPCRSRLVDVRTRIWDGIDDPHSVVAIMCEDAANHEICCIIEPRLSWLILELACGGDGSAAPQVEGCGACELAIIGLFGVRVARSTSQVLSGSADVCIKFIGASHASHLQFRCKPGTPVVDVTIEVACVDQQCSLSLILPEDALETLRQTEGLNDASNCQQITPGPVNLSDEIARAFVRVDAVLEERMMTAGELQSALTQRCIPLACTSLANVRADVEGSAGFACELGKSGSDLSLRIVDSLEGTVQRPMIALQA